MRLLHIRLASTTKHLESFRISWHTCYDSSFARIVEATLLVYIPLRMRRLRFLFIFLSLSFCISSYSVSGMAL